LALVSVVGARSAHATSPRAHAAAKKKGGKKKGGVVSTIFVQWARGSRGSGIPKAVVATKGHTPRPLSRIHRVEHKLGAIYDAAPNGRLLEIRNSIYRPDLTHKHFLGVFPLSEGIPPFFGGSSSFVWNNNATSDEVGNQILTRSVRGSGGRVIQIRRQQWSPLTTPSLPTGADSWSASRTPP
jgi:hypothetical protein